MNFIFKKIKKIIDIINYSNNNIDYIEKIIQKLLNNRRNNSDKHIDLKEEELFFIRDKSLSLIKNQN